MPQSHRVISAVVGEGGGRSSLCYTHSR
jgi:hypothetical protein